MLKDFEYQDYQDTRKFIIEIIMQTDMAKHFGYTAELNSKLKTENFDLVKNRKFLLTGLVHAADISSQGKPFHMAKLWTMRILTEFFSQVSFEGFKQFLGRPRKGTASSRNFVPLRQIHSERG